MLLFLGEVYRSFRANLPPQQSVLKYLWFWVVIGTITSVSVGVFYLLGMWLLIHQIFATTSVVDHNITYGKPLYYGENDGIMFTDRMRLFDNHTFYSDVFSVETNGYYKLHKDTVHLFYSSYKSDTLLPDYYIFHKGSLIGYRHQGSSEKNSSVISFYSIAELQQNQQPAASAQSIEKEEKN